LSLQDCVRVISIVKAVQRIPKPRTGITFFSENDVWLYQAVMDTKVCPVCTVAEKIEQFRGNNLRINFPYLEILDVNTIQANVHPNCRCLLVRVIGATEKV